ncbi:hypothetical protein TD95_003627 [Thielaviopsis punctulata]|uniref:Proteasome assembly chaperone 3 n=1 Tax=Thielaviopsis punctulata TaxID=72032 RepID=A0A0F4ZJ12_9PEZI|nr:hypothetical protein TD95_003627 [Thielaviopsis punctulata]
MTSPAETEASTAVSQFSLPLPCSIDHHIFLRMERRGKSVMLFLMTGVLGEAKAAALGSFVYALPDKFNPTQPVSTVLYAVESTVELTTRLAKMVARKTGLPVYVSNSMSLESTGMGGSAEEEFEAFKRVVEVVTAELAK